MPNIIVPRKDQLEVDMHNDVKAMIDQAVNHRQSTKFNASIDNNEKRYMAMRSIRGLDYKDLPKTKPWKGCSDIGIPIDAITIQAIVARVDRTEWERLPLTYVSGTGPQDRQWAPKIEAYLDWQKLNKMRLRIPKMMTTRRTAIDGSYFMKTVFEEKSVYRDEMILALRDPDTKKLLRDENDELVEWSADEMAPLNESMHAYELVPLMTPKKKLYYRSPRMYGRNVKQIIWAPDEDTPVIDDWAWIADTYYRSPQWLEANASMYGEHGEERIKELLKNRQDKASEETSQSMKQFILTKKVLIHEWHGQYKVKSKNRDAVFAYAPQEGKYLGWEYDEFKQRTGSRRFIHRTLIPMDGRVIGMSIPTFIKGLRDTIDVVFNQMMDRGSRWNNPPVVYLKGPSSGFDPRVHNFGYRWWPEKEKNSIRVLQTPRGESIEFAKIELLIGLVQRLFGVTDTTAGIENPANQTFGGIATLLAEGNVNIDMIISTLNESNIELDKHIIKHNAMNVGEAGEDFPIIDSYSAVMEDPENPFLHITEEELLGDYNYTPSGATLTVNTQTRRQEAGQIFDTVMKYKNVNPALEHPDVIYEVTKDFFKEFGKKNIKIPTPQEIQAKMEEMMANALTQAGQKGAPGG